MQELSYTSLYKSNLFFFVCCIPNVVCKAVSLYRRQIQYNFTYLISKLDTAVCNIILILSRLINFSQRFRHLFDPPLEWLEFAHMFDLVVSRDFACSEGDV